MPFSIAIHGGAGTINRSNMDEAKAKIYHEALQSATQIGFDILASGGSAIDAVTHAVISLENCHLFNAGKGSVYTHDKRHEMDASIMDGSNLDAGAVTMVQNIKNPVLLARTIMDKSEHVFLCGAGAEEFARIHKLVFESDDYFNTETRLAQLMEAIKEDKIALDHNINVEKKFGTVGAVARDSKGNLAAATSTGGLTNKRFNRIGDSPIIGAGTYANNNTCAISCTGVGEFFLRGIVAYDVSCLIEYKGMSLQEACEEVIMKKQMILGGEGGLIGMGKNGDIALVFNSEGMYRGWGSSGVEIKTAIYGLES
ncbi:MAG TPA: isoaspartyl peptidase/L-asparaginase [Saprospiraceae bacterium]|nr:isoaspartyl peptidase/L-asparaginase [Saprospiraceae bacterium]